MGKRGKGAQARSQEVSRQGGGRKPSTGDRKLKQEPEEWEEVANRRVWAVGQGFYKATPDRLGLICWICHYEGHRAVNSSTKWGLPLDFNELRCTKCSRSGHKAKWCGIKWKLPDTPVRKPASGKQAQGNAGGLPQSRK